MSLFYWKLTRGALALGVWAEWRTRTSFSQWTGLEGRDPGRYEPEGRGLLLFSKRPQPLRSLKRGKLQTHEKRKMKAVV